MTGFKSKKAMSDNRFGQVFEDPLYDEDGNCVDEDYDEEQGQRVFDKLVREIEIFSPHQTSNS